MRPFLHIYEMEMSHSEYSDSRDITLRLVANAEGAAALQEWLFRQWGFTPAPPGEAHAEVVQPALAGPDPSRLLPVVQQPQKP